MATAVATRIRNHHLIIKNDDKTVRKYVITRDITDDKPGI